MKIAVIGATGMIGHHTAKAVLARGHELVVVHRKSSKLDLLGDLEFESAIGDLDDAASLKQALSGADAVINCAGYYPTLPRPWQEDVRLGTQQMDNFYAACRQLPLQKIVYLGAAIALRKDPDGKPGHADLEYSGEPPNKNPYVQVKWAMDRQAKQQAAQGLPVVIGIPSMTFGEYDAGPTTGRIIKDLANGEMPKYVRGNRNVIYAGDAGRGLVLACESGRVGERYLFTGTNLSMDELMPMIASIAKVPAPSPVPLGLAKMVAKVQAFKYRWLNGPIPKLNDTAIAVLSAGQFLDGGKAQRELGFQAEVSVEEAIRRTLAWFREVGYVH